MTDKERIKELEAEIEHLKRNPAAKFYAQLVGAIEHVGAKLDEKKLDLDTDSFAKAVITLSEKSAKIFEGLQKGIESFEKSEVIDKKREANVSKSQAVPLA